jgi:hypothetical protein
MADRRPPTTILNPAYHIAHFGQGCTVESSIVTSPKITGEYPEVDGCGPRRYSNPMDERLKGRLQAAWRWLLQRQPQLDYARDYWDVLVKQWNLHLFETTSPVGVAFLVWWLAGAPPVTFVLCALVWVFLLAGYYAWRAEHLKVITPRFSSDIAEMALVDGRLFISVQISNLGAPTSIRRWQASFTHTDGKRIAFSENYFMGGDAAATVNVRGANLLRDRSLIQTGETREGFVAFDVGDVHHPVDVFNTVKLYFHDTLADDHQPNEVSTLPQWARELKR